MASGVFEASHDGSGLELRDVTVRIGGRAIVQRVTFRVTAGEIAAVLGPNGAGKTTLLRAIVGLVPGDGGMRACGIGLGGLGLAERARLIAYVPQGGLLDAPLPVRDVVEQGRYPHTLGRALSRADRVAVNRAMEIADVAVFADRPYTELSFGQRRRVLLARALATGAPVILLDEPSASLDIAHALGLFRVLRDLADDGRCVVAVLHQLDEALRFTDRALLLADGVPAAAGPTRDVIALDPVRRVYGVDLIPAGGLGYRLTASGRGGADGGASKDPA